MDIFSYSHTLFTHVTKIRLFIFGHEKSNQFIYFLDMQNQ